MYISPHCRLALVPLNFMKFGVSAQLADRFTSVKYLVNRLRDYRVLTSPKLPFPIELLRYETGPSLADLCRVLQKSCQYSRAVLLVTCWALSKTF